MEFTQAQTFFVQTCCHEGCGVQFGMTREFEDRKRQDGSWFYCPNGHHQHYTRTTEQVLREQLAAKERSLAYANEEAARQKEMRQKEERRSAAFRGQLTNIKRCARNGVCPCCHRSFENVRRHMATKHPAFAKEQP